MVGFPLGYAYAYLIKWIPFIYLNFFITLGYGFLLGLGTGFILKFSKVRSGLIAGLCALSVGLIAWYLAWSAHIHSLVDEAPWFLYPHQVWAVMKLLYAEGSWGLGFSSSAPVTGVILALVWLVEAGMIVGLCVIVGYGMVADTPFCEQHGCWLDEEKKISKLDAIVDPNHIAALQTGDLSPLNQARPRVPASGRFARLTIKHSDHCHDFCTLSVENVSVTLDKEGKTKEEKSAIVSNLMVPKTMFDYLARFDHITADE